MVNIDATTPQLKLVKQLLEAYISRDIDKVVPFISKDFKFESFPKTADLPDEAGVAHIQRYGPILTALTKAELIIHEVIEAPGKVVLHVTGVGYTILGTTHDYDSLVILTIVEEDGELKILNFKDFSDPGKRTTFFTGVAKAVATLVPGL